MRTTKQWHKLLNPRLKDHNLLSPTQFARAVNAFGGRTSKQVCWKWKNGELPVAGNILPICRALNMVEGGDEEREFIVSWLNIKNGALLNGGRKAAPVKAVANG